MGDPNDDAIKRSAAFGLSLAEARRVFIKTAWGSSEDPDVPREAWFRTEYGSEWLPDPAPPAIAEFWRRAVQDLVEKAEAGHLSAAKELAELAIVELEDPHHRPTWEMTQWLIRLLQRLLAVLPKGEITPSALLSPTRGGRPDLSNDLAATYRLEFLKRLAIYEMRRRIGSGESVDSAGFDVTEYINSLDLKAVGRQEPYDTQTIKGWYFGSEKPKPEIE